MKWKGKLLAIALILVSLLAVSCGGSSSSSGGNVTIKGSGSST